MSSIFWTDENQVSAVYTSQEKFENVGFNLKTHQIFFRSHHAGGISSLGLCQSRKTCAGKSHRDAIVFKKLRFQNVFKMFLIHKKMGNWRFQIPPVLRAFSNRSRTVGIKLHYLIPAALFGRYLNLVDRESSFFLVKCESERESEGEIYFVM